MKYKFLIIDDGEGIRYTIKAFLVEKGYKVYTVSNYDEAVEQISKREFKVIFADIMLGEKTGIDFLRIVKEREITSPVIMITGFPNIKTASEAVRFGAFDYIPKPIKKDVILKVSRLALQYKEALEEKEKYRKNLKSVFESVKEGILTVDKDLKVTASNESAKKICLPRNFPTKIFFQDLIKKEKTEEFTGYLKTVIKKREPVELFQIVSPFKKNPTIVVSLSINPFREESSGAVIVIRDETRLFNLERTLLEREAYHNIIGKNKKMQKIYCLLKSLSSVPTTVLITGESGTGKELIADALHYTGIRKEKPFIKINCSALPDNLLESELFGHIKGAFTGAIKDKSGRFELADRGTIFLDEIGDITPALQLRLLRVLQEKEFERVGGTKAIKVDVRIIAATNQELAEKIKRGEFREDLYYRLKVIKIDLPPLRERKEDIPALVKHFINKFNKKFKKKINSISRDTKKILMNYSWPGNIRELENVVEHAFILCQSSIITPEDLPDEITAFFSEGIAGEVVATEKEKILLALNKTGWNKAKAAKYMGMSRSTLYRKIKNHEICEERTSDIC